jgi:ATP-dependent Lhr-like helicase
LASPVSRWFQQAFPSPTPAQAAATPVVLAGSHALIVSPTGTGKTLAAFLGILHQLALEHAKGTLQPSLQALYISPLRALAHDLSKNLQLPLSQAYNGNSPIHVALRSGDTDPAERRRQFAHPPHLLLTTPESLGLLLSQERWIPHLATVRWVVIDEIHALAPNKRGADLALSLERLTHVVGKKHPHSPPGSLPQRIGLSATVAPTDAVAAFVAGAGRPCPVIQVPTTKRMDLQVYTPLQRDPYPVAGFSGVRLLGELARLIHSHRTTLIFTNTRSGAESTTFWLREQHPDLAHLIECHHASLDRDLRLDVEDRLKRGELRAVICSTSLELGIDIGSIDLVVMLATPKGVNRALQRTGRAGHRIDQVSHGLLMATNVGDLVECCATARLARAGHLDAIRFPNAPLDVLAQHLVGMGCLQEWNRTDAFNLIRLAHPYQHLDRADFDAVLEYLAGGGQSLRAQYSEVFGRIHLDPVTFETRAGATRRDFLQNIGTIATEGVVRVLLRNAQLGTVEEGFLRSLRIGDVFTLAGRPVRLDRMGTMECWVSRADGALPTVPRWGNNKFPLANRVAHEIRSFRRELRQQLESRKSAPFLISWINQRLDCGANNAAIILRVHAAQHGVSEIPTPDFLLVEELLDEPRLPDHFRPTPTQNRSPTPSRSPNPTPLPSGQLAMAAIDLPARASSRITPPNPSPPNPSSPPAPRTRHFFFHSLIGRAANDALSRVVGLRLGRLRGGNPVATADDYGFVLSVAENIRITPDEARHLLQPADFSPDLEEVLRRSDLLKYHFRNAAQTGLMVYRNHFDQQKSARKLQWSAEVIFNVLLQHEPNHVLLREARRDAGHAFLDVDRALNFLTDFSQHARPIHWRTVDRVPPLSFGMYATRIREALLVEDPRETLERLHHHWWQALGGDPIPTSP